MLDGFPIPPCPDCYRSTGPVEAWFGLMLSFFLLLFSQFLWMPSKWVDTIWKIMFPFAPRKD